MKTNKSLRYLGSAILVISLVSAWCFYDWKLAIILFLALAGNNLEQNH